MKPHEVVTHGVASGVTAIGRVEYRLKRDGDGEVREAMLIRLTPGMVYTFDPVRMQELDLNLGGLESVEVWLW